jgi:hypothetical protein
MEWTEGELRFGVGVNLLAQRLDRAAHAARRLAVALRGHPVEADNAPLRSWFIARGEIADCLADALDARRGSAEGWKALHADRPNPLSPACAVLRVDLFDGKERVQSIRGLPKLAANVWDVPTDWLDLLAAEADPSGKWPPRRSINLRRAALVPNDGALAGLIPAIDARRAGSAARIFTLLSSDDTSEEAAEIARLIREGSLDPTAMLAQSPAPDEGEKNAWALVMAGDGEGLAAWLRRPVSQPGTFLRFGAPLLRSGKDAVARWIRWGYRPPVSFRPTDDVIHLANLAAAAGALGDGEAAALFRARGKRLREAILRRETAIPLAVLERL